MKTTSRQNRTGAGAAANTSLLPAHTPQCPNEPTQQLNGAPGAHGVPPTGGAPTQAPNGPQEDAAPPLGPSQLGTAVQNGLPNGASGTPAGFYAAPPVAYRPSPLAAAQVISTFTGDNSTESVDRFLLVLRSVAQLDGWTPEIIREILVLKTEGSANILALNLSPDARGSLDAIEIAFRRRFKQPWSLDVLEQQIFALCQDPQESVDHFYGRVIDLGSRLRETTPVPPGLSAAQVRTMLDDRLLRAFITGLHPSLLRIVRAQRPSNLEEAKRTALFEEQSEKLAKFRPVFTPEVTVAALHATAYDPSSGRTCTRQHAAATGCFECGEMGHDANKCPQRICGRCMKSGHRPRWCPSLYPDVSDPKNLTPEDQ